MIFTLHTLYLHHHSLVRGLSVHSLRINQTLTFLQHFGLFLLFGFLLSRSQSGSLSLCNSYGTLFRKKSFFGEICGVKVGLDGVQAWSLNIYLWEALGLLIGTGWLLTIAPAHLTANQIILLALTADTIIISTSIFIVTGQLIDIIRAGVEQFRIWRFYCVF